MKQVLLRDGKAVVEEVPVPTPRPGWVLVRTAFSLLSAGTERAVLKSTERTSLLNEALRPGRLERALELIAQEGPAGLLSRVAARRLPAEAIPGYAASGHVDAVGSGVADLPPGTAVACAGAGYACHAEMMAVPRNLVVPVPAGVRLEEAAFTTLGAIALQGVRRASPQIGETSIVLGLGLVGSLTAQILRASGIEVIGFDADPVRAARARSLGFEAFDLAARDPREEVPRRTRGLLADSVIVCAASEGSEVTRLALQLARKKGRVVLVGDVGLDIDRALMYEKELDLLMSTSYGPGRYDPSYEEQGLDYPAPYVRWTENRNMAAFLALVANGRVRIAPLLDRVLPMEQAEEAYRMMSQGEAEKPLGVVLRYGTDAAARRCHASKEPDDPRSTADPKPNPAAFAAGEIEPIPSGQGPIAVLVCGAGAFVKASHLPVLRRLPGYAVETVVAATPASARDTARRHGIARATTSLGEALASAGGSLVLIGTRHHLHAAQAREALRAGRHVLVEKPLCLDEAEIEPVLAEARRARRLIAVGFNRRYSPLARRTREVLGQLDGPALMVYRVNAGALPAGHWVHDPREGGGRVVGECCHFVDILMHLVKEGLDSVEARALPSDNSGVVRSDSFVATFSFDGGSRAVLIYTGLGDKGLPKERLEIFKGGAALVLDDYLRLTVFGGPGGSLSLRHQDKGIEAQWEAIARKLRGEPSDVITPAEIERTMRATFRLDRAVRGER